MKRPQTTDKEFQLLNAVFDAAERWAIAILREGMAPASAQAQVTETKEARQQLLQAIAAIEGE